MSPGLDRTFYIKLAWACLLLCLVISAALALVLTGSSRPDFQALKGDWLGRSSTAMQLKLHATQAGDPFQNATESDYFQLYGNLPSRPQSHIDEPDGRSFDLYRRPDLSLWIQLEYYPIGDQGRMLKHGVKFAEDSEIAAAEIAFRPSGTRQMTGARMANGDYLTSTYFDDGRGRASETLAGLGPDTYDKTSVLLGQTKWDHKQRIVFTHLLNADKSRTLTSYDDDQTPLVVSHLVDGVNGSSVIGYFPGTKVVRIRSTSEYRNTSVDFFRPDATLSMHMDVNSAIAEFTFFDSTGTRATLYQEWSFDQEVQDGISRMKNLRLQEVTEMDQSGNPLCRWVFWAGGGRGLFSMSRFNVEVDGVRWDKVLNLYNQNGFLTRVSYVPLANSGIDRKPDEHTQAEGIGAPAPPPSLLVLTPIDDIFAIPARQIYHF